MSSNDFELESPATEITIDQLVEVLLDASQPLQPLHLLRLSDLEGAELEKIHTNWANIPLVRRQTLMEDLEQLASEDYVLFFESVARIALEDQDARVRLGGVKTLVANECDDPELIPLLLDLAEHDPNDFVRASSAAALGAHVYRGELEAFPQTIKHDLENRLLAVAASDDLPIVRLRALEALGYSGRDEVASLINEAYASDDAQWIASALLAMGRSADEQWNEHVLQNITHANDLIRLEAVRAAGELDLSTAKKHLINNLSDEQDEIRLASIWSLSQIGGEGIAERLAQQLKRAQGEDEISFIEQALENLAFNLDLEAGFGMFYVPGESDEGDAVASPGMEIENLVEDEDFEDEDYADEDPYFDDEDDDRDLWAIEDLIDDDDDMD
jgi:HEAT repeat protein